MIYCDKVEYKKFDEAEFLIQCVRKFEDIRIMYNLNEEILKRAQEVSWLRKAAELVIEGCTEQGILEMEKNKLPEWEKEREKYRQSLMSGAFITFSSVPRVVDLTAEKVDSISSYYDEKCCKLCHGLELLGYYDEEIRGKEELAANGDVAAMLFLGKVYEKGKKGRRQDDERARLYYQMAKDTWATDLSKRYMAWLEQAVKDSGLESIGRLGCEYIAGSFAETAKKNSDAKLKHEIRWLNKAIKEGDGWAAFTKGNICYYGYGRWTERKKEAYNNYIKASKSKESIYPLELEEMSFDRTKTVDYQILEAVLRGYDK